MMARTDRHYRFMARRIARRPLLYTEMVTTGALLHGDRERHLAFDPAEAPVALQLGGDDPGELATCARLAEERGYDEVNLNVGCPSDRVQQGSFGVCLMGRPERVAAAVEAMRGATRLPVTVKHRIGFDDRDRYEDMAAFVDRVAEAGCDRFTVHARKAWLQGLSPKENRNVPPLRPEEVYRLARERPDLEVELNGGVTDLDQVCAHLEQGIAGVMVGRGAWDDPWMLAAADARLWGDPEPPPCRREVVEAMVPYAEARMGEGTPLHRITRPLLGLFTGRPGARAWRRFLSETAHRDGAGPELLLAALAEVPEAVREERPVVASPASVAPASAAAP